MKFFVSLLIGLLGVVAAPARAQSDNPDMTVEVLGVYFTPPANAVAAIIKTIDASEREVLVQAYGFTHNAIAQALVRAHHRGVAVRVLLDDKSKNTNRYVIDVLTQAQMDVRYDGNHAIAHNKIMVVDESVVITGSFNFTNSAETRNAENFLILKSPELARQYKANWQSHWGHAAR